MLYHPLVTRAEADWVACVVLGMALVTLVGCAGRRTPALPATIADSALARRIGELVDTFLMSDDPAKSGTALGDARLIFEREGIPGVPAVGDTAAYGFVLVNVLGQPPDFRNEFSARLQDPAVRRTLPDDALAFAAARHRQAQIEERYRSHTPSHPEVRDEISRLIQADQAVRQRDAFDREKIEAADLRTGQALAAILDRYGVPTYDMVGVRAAKEFIVMVQHLPPTFRTAVLPKLKANVDAAQADPETYAMVYDRAQRDQGKPQRYGQQLECTAEKTLNVAPIEDAPNVNLRRAKVGLMRLELYVRLVRAQTPPDMCGAV